MASRYEQETIIRFNEADKTAQIYTASKRVKAICEKKGYEKLKEEPEGWFYQTDKMNIRLSVKRVLSAEQQVVMRARAMKMLGRLPDGSPAPKKE